MFPESARAHKEWGIYLYEKGKKADASFHFTKALDLEPRNDVLTINRGVVYSTHKDYDNAIIRYI